MNPCEYCIEYNKTHVDAHDILSILDKLEVEDKAKLAAFIHQVANEHFFHSTHAVAKIDQICRHCGEWKAKEDDGDRYYYTCDNNKCSAF